MDFLPTELLIFFFSALPISELRGAIPLAFSLSDFSLIKIFWLAVFGNLIPVILLLWGLGPVSGFLVKHFSWADKFFTWLFARTRHKFSGRYERLGALALILFVAIPLPLTGAWTGSVAAFLFGIPKKQALALITVGVLIAGLIITLATAGLWQLIFNF